jgi:hypothetical protein
VYIEKNKIFIGPDDGTRLPILDMVHKVTAESFGGALTIIEWGLPPGAMIPRIPIAGRTSATSCWRAS